MLSDDVPATRGVAAAEGAIETLAHKDVRERASRDGFTALSIAPSAVATPESKPRIERTAVQPR
jgi:hypothetical protein